MLQGRRIEPPLFRDQFLRREHAILRPRLLLHLRRHIARVIVLAVAGQAQERRHHQLRRAAFARPCHRAADHFEAIGQLRPIHFMPFVAVALRPIDQPGAGKLAIVFGRISKVIIRRHEHERHLLHRRDIHPLVRRARLHAAFADCR